MNTSIKDKVMIVSPADKEMIAAVIAAACQYYSVSESLLFNEHKLAGARHMCFYIIKENAHNISDPDIGVFFNRKRTAVSYGIDLIDHHKCIYRQTLGTLNSIIEIANTFEKKYQWHIPLINITL